MMIANVIRTSTSLPAPRHHEAASISEHTTNPNPIRFHALAGSMNNQGAGYPLVSIHVGQSMDISFTFHSIIMFRDRET